MSEVLFYHLERARLEDALPGLLEKTLDRGWRAIVRAGVEESVRFLDDKLWTWRDDAFLPHGADADLVAAARQPVWLTTGRERPNAPDVLFAVDDAEVGLDEIAAFRRCVVMFNGTDEASLARARELWKSLRGGRHEVTYWRQDADGRWGKQG